MKQIRKKEGFEGQRAIVMPREVIDLQCAKNPVIQHAYVTDIGYYPRALHHYRQRLGGIDQNILIYCVEGKGWVQVEESRQNIVAGNFFILPAHTPHSYASDKDQPWTIYWLHIRGKTADNACASIVQQLKGHKGVVKYSQKRIDLFDEIYSALERGYSYDQILYANMSLPYLLASFAFDEKFDTGQASKAKDAIDVAIDFMHDHVAQSLSLAQIASSANLSASHFVALFHKKTGFAPVAYFNHLKIQKACQYLQFTDELVKEIAYAIGIEDHYYFSRLFKKLMGVSPLEYRQRLQNVK